MATKIVSNTGGNFSVGTTWVGNLVPVSGDTIGFTATSGPLIINSGFDCSGIDFTNYTNTITFTALLTVLGPINLGTGGYTQAGASGINIPSYASSSQTHTSGGVTWSRLWIFGRGCTLSGVWTFTGSLFFTPSGTMTINGTTINTLGLTVNSTGIINGTANIVFNGTGTWSHTAAGYIQNNVTINTLGTLTIGTNIYYRANTLTYTAGTVITTGSTLTLDHTAASTTINCSNMDGITTNKWNNITLSGNTATVILSSNLNLSGTLTLGGVNSMTLTGNTITVGGNLTVSGTAIVSGTTAILFNGTGTWNHTAAGVIRNNVTINPSGTLTIGTNIYYNTGTLTYTAGTVVTTGSTLNISASTTLNTSGIPWNNITITATSTLTFTSNLAWSGTFSITTGNTTFAGVGTMSGAALTITTTGTVTLNNNITCTGLVTLGITSAGCTLSSSGGTRTIITSGGLTNATTSAITFNVNIRVTGGIITSGSGYYQVNTGYQFEIDGNVSFSASTFYIYGGVATGTGGTFKHTSGTVTTTGSSFWINSIYVNSGTITWDNVWFLTGGATTSVLQSDMTVNGLLTLGYLTVGFTINNDGTARTIIANGGITMSGSTSVVLGTANIRATGGIITGVSSVQLRNNLELAGNVTFANGATFSYNTGTLLYTSGTITTTNSTIAIGVSTTLDTDRGATQIDWNNVITSGTTTITLSSNLNIANLTAAASSIISFVLGGNLLSVTNNLSIFNSSAFNTPNNLQVTNLTIGNGGGAGNIQINGLFTISVSGNLTENRGGVSACSGTTSIVLNGTGTWSNTSTGSLRNNLSINSPSGTITTSGNLYYQTSILTYTAGTVITTGSTLSIVQTTTLNTGTSTVEMPNGIIWNTIIVTQGTQTLTSNLNCQNFTMSNISNITINNSGGNIYISGNLSNPSTFQLSGTASINLIGTGTWSHSSTGAIRNNLNINTSGTLTISGNIYYSTGTLTYTTGTVDTSGSTLNIPLATTFNTNILLWNNITFTSGTQTLTSNLNLSGNLTSTSTTINGLFNVNIGGNLRNVGIATTAGTATLVLNGTGTFSADSSSTGFQNNLIINTKGTITLGTTVSYGVGTLTYITGKIITKNSTFYLISSCTLINCHKINFNNVIIGVTSIITMNEFFSGSPSLVTNISSNAPSTNNTIAFQDGFEKISKFVNISNCTLSKPLQLLVLTKSKRSSTNRGIRYINQSPNGISKGDPSIQNQTTFGASGLLSDPNMR